MLELASASCNKGFFCRVKSSELATQMLGGQGQASVGGAASRSPGAHAADSSDEFAALDALPPAEATRWRQTIM
jgi:hypothetical protein